MAPIATTDSISHGTSELERRKRVRAVKNQLPDLVQSVARDLSTKLEWAPYLAAAPAAICVMATCLVAGSSDDTSSIEVNIAPRVSHGIEIKPHKYLGTNLQYCSDLGRRAFNDAQAGMQSLQGRADLVIGKMGALAQIMEILNDSQPDFSSLEIWMKELQETAAICQDEAKSMKANFMALLDFIMDLKTASIEAMNANKKNQIAEKASQDVAALAKYEEELQKLDQERNKLQKELDKEKGHLKCAQDEVKAILQANPWQDTQDKINEINDKLREIELNEPSSWNIFGKIWGNAQKAKKDREKRKKSLLEQRKRFLAQRGDYVNCDQESALNKVEDAQRRVAEAERMLRSAQDKYTSLMRQQFQASKSLDNACEDLQTLSDRTLDLKTIETILRRSIKSLRELNKYVDEMASFFMEVSRYVDDAMKNRFDQFKKKTSNVMGMAAASRTGEENNRHKTFAIMAALDLYGRFNLISDIARIYVDVSKKHIKPGINMMDGLTYLDEDEYGSETAELKKWGEKAVKDINALAIAENEKVETAVFTNMKLLVEKQIGVEMSNDSDGESE